MTSRLAISFMGIALIFSAVYAVVAHGIPTAGAQSRTSQAISGFGWSDTIGWISFDCSEPSLCPAGSYQVNVDPESGLVSGYAWSEHVGWISFNRSDLSGCAQAPCEARLRDDALTGWARVLAGGTAQSGGWDGFIRLSGVEPSYGPRLTDGVFSGYAWGSDVVGWVDMALTRLVSTACSDAADNDGDSKIDYPSDPGCDSYADNDERDFVAPENDGAGWSLFIRAEPRLVRPNGTTRITWGGTGVGACRVDGPGLSSTLASGSAEAEITEQSTFTIQCRRLDDEGSPSGEAVSQSVAVGLVPASQEI